METQKTRKGFEETMDRRGSGIKKENTIVSNSYDHIGQYIGQARIHEGITQEQLSRGLCTRSLLSRIENGSREVEALLAVALLQRLGKPVDLFTLILNREEFESWKLRQEISSSLRQGKIDGVADRIARYQDSAQGALDFQFAKTAELNLCALLHMPERKLLTLAKEALELTNPGLAESPLDGCLFSRNEGYLLLAILELREQLEGTEVVEEQYRALLRVLNTARYEVQERIYLLPYVSCHVVAAEYRQGRYAAALATCEATLGDLTAEKRLFAYDRLLEWKQRIFDAMGYLDQTPRLLLARLRQIQKWMPQTISLLAPCEDRSIAVCLNDVIRTRRTLLTFTQEKLAEDVYDVGAISRIENHIRIPQKHKRRSILKKVNMSGERYDYEIISSQYETYLLRSSIGRALNRGNFCRAQELLEQLRQKVPELDINRQYFLYVDTCIRGALPSDHPNWLSPEQRKEEAKEALCITLPLDIETIACWPTCVLTINEISHLIVYGMCCKRQGQLQEALQVFSYIRCCLENHSAGAGYPEHFYVRVVQKIVSILGDMGRFEESNRLCQACIQRILENQDSRLLAILLYNYGWNLEQGLDQLARASGGDRNMVLSLFQLAYASTVFSDDMVGQRYILTHCKKVYGVDLQL